VPMRTLEWDEAQSCLRLIDQRRLPNELTIIACRTYRQVAQAIQEMAVRGAPAIGVAAAFGLALAARQSATTDPGQLRRELEEAASFLRKARPTAVNLDWGIQRVLQAVERADGHADEMRNAALAAAARLAEADVQTNKRMAGVGAAVIDDGDTIIHHCNTGALAAVDWGTALGVIRMAHEQGKRVHVLVDETRPRLQGARLTAWELQQYGIPYDIISDGASGYFLRSGFVHKVLFGADRIAANGDVANKIGTYLLALAARDNAVPVYAVAPFSTVDLSLSHGDLIPIEERDPQEVLDIQVGGQPVAPARATARNPAFDVTPHRLLTAIITEFGIVQPPFNETLAEIGARLEV
jgi:methylthioribose-1-phosphate isomerase